jgi:hypothetical protein
MMNAKVIFKDLKDKEFLDNISLETPIFVDYINIDSVKGKKEGWKILNYYGTTKLPFVELQLDKIENRYKPFYSENGNAVFQLINYINNL